MTFSGDSSHFRSQAISLLAVRLLIAPLYLYSGFGKVLEFSRTAARLPGGDSLLGYLLALAAIAVELGGGTLLIFGLWNRGVSIGLIIFTAIATLMFHQFWAAHDHASVVVQTVNFLKNLGLIGGLQLIAVFGAGPFTVQSIDGLFAPQRVVAADVSANENTGS